jgi:hypothetical protein
MKRLIVLFLIIILPISFSEAREQQLTLSPGINSHAMGHSGRGNVFPLEAVFLNPSTLSRFQGYYIGGNTSTFQAEDGQRWKSNIFSIADNTGHQFFPASFGYWERKSLDGSQELKQYVLGGAYNITNVFSLGASARRVTNELEGVEEGVNNLDLGAFWNPIYNVAVGAVINNAAGSKAEWGIERTYSLGLLYVYKGFFTIQADTVFAPDRADRSPWTHMLGMESVLGRYWAVRMGQTRFEGSDAESLSYGLAFKGPKLELGYSFSKIQTPPFEEEHKVDLSISL